MNYWCDDAGQWYYKASCGHTVARKGKHNAKVAADKGSKCRDCARLPENNPMYGKTGDLNPFFGKVHTLESRRTIGEKRSAAYQALTDEQKQEIKEHLANYSNQEHPYQIWLRKYGLDIANQLYAELKIKQSLNAIGTGNPMYGKPAPNGSGNGWKGWLDGKFFRSLRELSFGVNNPEFVTAESNEWRAVYTDETGSQRTTIADFINHEDKVLIECKPARLHDTLKVLTKAEALARLAEQRGYIMQLVDPEPLSKEEILRLVDSGRVVFYGDYLGRVEEWQER